MSLSSKEGGGEGEKEGGREEGVSDNIITKDAREKKKQINFKSTENEG